MILPFSTQFPDGTPTNFVGKIWQSVFDYGLNYEYRIHRKLWLDCVEKGLILTQGIRAKIHTIREDKHNRWKPGMKIHPVVFNRSKNQFQFAPTLKCVSVQSLNIHYHSDGYEIIIDDKILTARDIEMLSINDGFSGVEDFENWFSSDFSGKIIHWTDFKY